MAAIFAIVIVIAGLTLLVFQRRKSGQRKFIQNYSFPPSLRTKVKDQYPHLTEEQLNLVFDGLRDYFQFCRQAKNRMVSMPSRVVDIAWHEFILFTRAYKTFCQRGLGFFLHHMPAEAMKTPTVAQEGIKRSWRLACAKEKMNPSPAGYLPLLFAIDDLLQIEGGFKYRSNCMDPASPLYGQGYCAGHIGCTSGCAGGGSGSDGGFGAGSDASSCGGSGCGGGGGD